MVRRVVASVCTIVLTLSGAIAFAQAVPPGTYQQSCTNAHIRGAQVVANCSAPNGQRITSSTSILCGGDIGNANGHLRCNAAGGASPLPAPGIGGIVGGPLPAGPYRQTCTHAHMRGTVLVADCRTSSGAILRSSLDTRHCRSGAQIGNVDGLLCGR
jgi:hypothetical protein